MTVTVAVDSEFAFANQDRTQKIAYNSLNVQREAFLTVSYSDSQVVDGNGAVSVDLSNVLVDWNTIISVTIVEQDYENGIATPTFQDHKLSGMEFTHIRTIGDPEGATSRVLVAPATEMEDATDKIWVRGY